jgi:hypothetical protein
MAASDGMKDQSVDAGGYTPGQIRTLKIAIGIMTTAIFLGLAAMAYTVMTRSRPAKPVKTSAPVAAVDLKTLYPGAGPIAQAQMPPGGRITGVTPWGDRLVLTVEDTGGASLLALDAKTGQIVPLARLTPAP